MKTSPFGTLAVIPARLRSTRLPEKALRLIGNKSLVQRVWESAKQAKKLDRVVIATDAEEIATLGRSFGAEVVMTSVECSTGSERVLEAARIVANETLLSCGHEAQRFTHAEDAWSFIVNVQGDMPFVEPDVIDSLVKFLEEEQTRFSMATIATPILEEEIFRSSTVVKVAVSATSEALYFSRAPIPWPRDPDVEKQYFVPGEGTRCYGLKHIGLYAYTPEGLRAYDTAEQSPLERIEKLEQLRVLERGWRIGVHVVPPEMLARSIEVDTAEDLARAAQAASALK